MDIYEAFLSSPTTARFPISKNGEKYDGEWKKGIFWEGSAFDSSGNLLGKKVNGNWE